ncbi:pyocin knob domain-containing protein [Notoacmeibacter ruber]|uniref:Phage tail protein n=1 Tax=Notoacmeibacter ruber TaxID=2670375 RepID=A0A3L7JEL8_9HYPH|nr:pyocin knob domain-containing protein [Notoacmeibacter ruber]RLQ88920.1 hypothetical protein D8780_12465 [Notoacmeibacter ruber]
MADPALDPARHLARGDAPLIDAFRKGLRELHERLLVTTAIVAKLDSQERAEIDALVQRFAAQFGTVLQDAETVIQAIQSGQFTRAAVVESVSFMPTAELTVTLDALDPLTFAVTPVVMLGRTETTEDYAIARVMDYSPATRLLTVQILSAEGQAGPHDDVHVEVGALSTLAQAAQLISVEAKRAEVSVNTVAVAAAKTVVLQARDAVLDAYDRFDDRYLGEFAAAPSTDNDGDPLLGGALYFDTTVEAMQVFTGSAWVAAYVAGGIYATEAELNAHTGRDDNPHGVTKAQIGLENVANKSEAEMVAAGPVAEAIAAKLNGQPTELDATGATAYDYNAPMFMESGRWMQAGDAGAAATANPPAFLAHSLETIATDEKVVQIAYLLANGRLSSRTLKDGVWSKWGLGLTTDSMSSAPDFSVSPEAPAKRSAIKAFVEETLEAGIGAKALGEGQAWQNKQGSRTYNTSYQNTSGRSIEVVMSYSSGGSSGRTVQTSSDGVTWIEVAQVSSSSSVLAGTSFAVPNGHYYRINGSVSIFSWAELR